MPAIKLEQFGGMFPAWDGHLLPTGQATNAQNGFLFSGSLIGWRKPKLLRELANAGARFAYRVPSISRAQAHALLVFKTQPNDGDTVVVGEITYTFRTALSVSVTTGGGGPPVARIGLPFEVLIGGDINATAVAFAAALTADNDTNANSGILYGENTPLNGDVKYYLADTPLLPGINGPLVGNDVIEGSAYTFVDVGAVDFGASYNLIKTTESTSGARMTWLYDVGSFTHTTTTYKSGTNPRFDSAITAPSVWLEFEDPNTNVVKSPIVDDTWNRYYFASPSQMPEYNTYDRIQAGQPPWLLGVPPPGCAMTVDVTGGGNDLTLGHFQAALADNNETKGNRIYVIPVTPTGDVSLSNVSVIGDQVQFPTGGFPDAHYAAVLYTDTNGKPDQLLNTGQIMSGVAADTVNTSAFVNPTGLLAGSTYWLGIMIDTPIHSFLAGGLGNAAINDMASWPNTFTNGPNLSAPVTGLAHSQITSDNALVAAGDFIMLGGWKYTFVTAVVGGGADQPQVKIGASAAVTLLNLEHAINGAGGTPGTDYSTGTAPNGFVTAGAVSSLAIPITLRNASLGDGSNVETTFHSVGTPHLFFPDNALQVGFVTGIKSLNMYGSGLSNDVIESRSYVYTWVSEYGEEGPPSPPVLLDGWSNGVWTLGLWSPPPDDLGVLRNLKKLNIYRTVPGQGGATVFFFVKTIDIGTTFFVDDIRNDTVAFNDQLQTTNWFPPPENLQGLKTMQNGMVVGFVGNEVWFCEPYHTHAWPPGYVITVDFPIVGVGVTNGALVVCTAAQSSVITGTAPSSMTEVKCADANPCHSRGSILDGDGAVTFMSNNGLIQVTPNAVSTNTTDLWMGREKWQQLTPPMHCRAIELASSYYVLGSISSDGADTSQAQRGFTIELAQDNTSFTIWPQPGGHRLGFMNLDSPVDDTDISNVFTDPWTSTGLVIADARVYYFDFSDPAPTLATYTWRSKLYQQNAKRNYSCMKVFFTVPPGTPAQNPVRLEDDADSANWNELPADRYGYLRTYVDKDDDGSLTLIDCREIRKSGEVLRIVDGFKCDTWVFEIVGRVNISNVQIATTIKELAQV